MSWNDYASVSSRRDVVPVAPDSTDMMLRMLREKVASLRLRIALVDGDQDHHGETQQTKRREERWKGESAPIVYDFATFCYVYCFLFCYSVVTRI